MKQVIAKQKLFEEFDKWEREQNFRSKPTVGEAISFYADILREKAHLLDFKCAGDKWQKIKSWLYETSRIEDNPPSNNF